MNRDFDEMLRALSDARADLIANKRAAGRPKDSGDIHDLEG
jgi:hypothetical protein